MTMPEPGAGTGGTCARAGVAETPTRATPTTRVVATLRKPRRGSEGRRCERDGRMLVPPVEDDSTVLLPPHGDCGAYREPVNFALSIRGNSVTPRSAGRPIIGRHWEPSRPRR